MSWMSGRHRNVIQVMVGLLLAGELALASAIAGSPAAMPRGPLTIAVVGDQNTAGVKNRVVWPTLMAGRTGWSVSNFAQPETEDKIYDKSVPLRIIAYDVDAECKAWPRACGASRSMPLSWSRAFRSISCVPTV